MKRKATILIVLFLVSCALNTIAYSDLDWKSERDHNRWTEEIIFGNPSYKSSKPDSIELAIDQLEDAVLICIDQFNGHYVDKLADLNRYRIPGLPVDISAIDFPAGPNHRVYTHRGWNHKYTKYELEHGHADVRKEMLMSVVCYVFGFDDTLPATERSGTVSDAMCCLLYNTHLLGDRYHSDTYYGANSTLLLAEDSESIIHDTLELMPILFNEQRRSSEYATLERQLRKFSDRIIRERRNVATNDELLAIDKKYTPEIKDLLKTYIPGLLQQQSWFSAVFPAEWESSVTD